ncbi:MAG: response regulator [Asgard group archaeon]|nr:response regulator [Asgard group archaeon]
MITILLAEKEKETRNLFKKLLSKEGYDVLEVSDGKEALEQYEKLAIKPELIILGYRLPKKNGLEVIEEILNKNPNCHILMITGDPRIVEKQVNKGSVLMKTKPLSSEEFLKTVQEITQL